MRIRLYPMMITIIISLLLTGFLRNPAKAQFTASTFAGTSGTSLLSYSPGDGSTWAAFYANPSGMFLDGSGGVYCGGNDFYYVSNAGHLPSSDQFDIVVDLNFISSIGTNQCGSWVYYNNGGGTTYWGLFWNGANSRWELQWKLNNSQQTVTEYSTAVTPSVGNTYRTKLSVRTNSVIGLVSTNGGTSYTTLFTRSTNPLDSYSINGVGISGNNASTATSGVHFQNFSASNYTNPNPTFTSATVNSNGTTITGNLNVPGTPPLTFGGSASVANNGGFTVLAGGSPVTVSSASASGSTVTLNLASTVYMGQSVSVTYTAGGNGTLQDSAGAPNTVATVGPLAITNNSTQVANATGYSITPGTASPGTISNGVALSLPITLTGGTTIGSNLVLTATLASGLTGTFASTTSGVTITGSSSPYTITIPAATYASGINLSFTPNATATSKSITFTHTGGGTGFASGSDPGPFTYTVVNTPAFTLNQTHIYTNSVNDAMYAVGSNTSWLTSTTFSVSPTTNGAALVTNSVNATSQTAFLKLSAGSVPGTLTISDNADATTQSVTVQTPSQSISLASGSLLIGNTVTVTVTGANTLYNSQVGTYFTLGGTAGAASSISSTTINSDTSVTLTIVLGNATGALTVSEVAPYGGGATSGNSLTVTSSGGVITYSGKVTMSANNGPGGITLTAPTPSGIVGSAVYTWKRSTTAGFTFSTGTTVGTNAATITDNPGTSGQNIVYYYKVQIGDTNGDTPAVTNNSDQLITTQYGATIVVGGLGDSVMAGQNATTNFLAAFASELTQNYGIHWTPYINSTNNQGHGGAATTEWLPSNTSVTGQTSNNYYNTAKAAWNTMSPAMTDLIIELMTNDLTRGNSSAVFLSNMETIIDQIHSDFPTVRIWLTDSPVWIIQPDNNSILCAQFSADMDLLCSSTGPRASLVTGGYLKRLDKTWPSLVGGQKGNYLSSDNIHPNNAGQTAGGILMAYAFAKGMGLISQPTVIRRTIH